MNVSSDSFLVRSLQIQTFTSLVRVCVCVRVCESLRSHRKVRTLYDEPSVSIFKF